MTDYLKEVREKLRLARAPGKFKGIEDLLLEACEAFERHLRSLTPPAEAKPTVAFPPGLDTSLMTPEGRAAYDKQYPKPWHPEARWQQLGQAGNPERDPRLRYAVLSDQESDDPLEWRENKEEPAGPSDAHSWKPYGTNERMCRRCGVIDGATKGDDLRCLDTSPESAAIELLNREYGKDHPAARHGATVTFLTTTYAHQVRELTGALEQQYQAGRASLAKVKLDSYEEGRRFELANCRRNYAAGLAAKDARIAELEAKNAKLEAKVEAWAPVVETVSRVRRWAEDAGPVNEAFAAIPDALRPKS